MKLSVVIPVYNEQAVINQTISRVRAIAPECGIVVSDANSETVKVITDKDVTCVTSCKGRALQMNAGAAAADGDALLFLHADTELPAGFHTEIINALKTHDAGAFRLKIDCGRPFFRMIEKSTDIRTKLTKIPYGDQGIFCTREAFEKIGGYPDVPLLEDVKFMEACKKGKMNIYLSEMSVLTSARRWEKEGLIYGTFRNRAVMLFYFLGASPAFLKKFY
jgi:rSAM/selenodomain-associated transferase 2